MTALTIFALLFFAFVSAPLLVIVGHSVASPVNGTGGGTGGLTAYVESTDQLVAALRNSLTVAFSATAASTVIGTAPAIALARRRFRARGAHGGFLLMPTTMPDIVPGIGLPILLVTVGMRLSLITIIIGRGSRASAPRSRRPRPTWAPPSGRRRARCSCPSSRRGSWAARSWPS